MTAPTVAEQANAVSVQRVKNAAKDRAELDIASLCDYGVECHEDGRGKYATLSDDKGEIVAMFAARTWKGVIAAARGWSEVSR